MSRGRGRDQGQLGVERGVAVANGRVQARVGSGCPGSMSPGCRGVSELPPAGEGGALGLAEAQENDLGGRDGPGWCWGGDRWAPCPGRDSSAPLGQQEGHGPR